MVLMDSVNNVLIHDWIHTQRMNLRKAYNEKWDVKLLQFMYTEDTEFM